MLLVISVVSHGHGAILARALDDIVRFAPPASDIIVTLNIPEVVAFDRARWPRVQWIDNASPRGFGRNHNAALAGRDADWFAIVNPDIRLASDVFTPLMRAGNADIGLDLIVPAIRNGAGEIEDSARALPTPWSIARRTIVRIKGQKNPPASSERQAWYAGMFMLVRRNAFETVQGFDERFFLYCEDVDLCIRLSLAGFGLALLANQTVTHDAQRASLVTLRYLLWHSTSLIRLWSSTKFWRYWLIVKRRASGAPI